MSATPIDNSVTAEQHPTYAEWQAEQLAEQKAEEAARRLNAAENDAKFKAAAAEVRAQKREDWALYGVAGYYDCYQ